MTSPDALPLTDDPEAQAALARNPLALVIGLVLHQQVPTEKAFASPLELQRRLGRPLEAADLAAMDPVALEDLFRAKPALHRFPASMAKRVQKVCRHLADEYEGDLTRLWDGVADAEELLARLCDLPGFAEYKARIFLGLLAKWFDVRPAGHERFVPDWPSVVDVDDVGDLEELRVRKREWKAAKA